MSIEAALKEKLQKSLAPTYFEVVNESSSHHRNPEGETHFGLLVVSLEFEGKSRVERQRLVQDLFSDERSLGLHALTMTTFTPAEWSKNPRITASPACQG